jgi:hypothetical protein
MPLIAALAKVHRRRWRLAAHVHPSPRTAASSAGAAFVLPSARVGWGRLPVRPAAPSVKRRAPVTFTSRSFSGPLLMRRLFGDAAGDVVALLAAPSTEETAEPLLRLAGRTWTADQARVIGELRALMLGETTPAQFWGDDPAADELRLRPLRSGDAVPGALGWGRFLAWAGARLEAAPVGKLPPELARAATAGLVSARGYRDAFRILTRRGRVPWAFREPLGLVALRCALDGVFLPQFIAYLLPRKRRRRADGSSPWTPSLLALHAYHARHDVAGIVHLTAALVAADIRERLVFFASRDTAAFLRRQWGAPLPPDADQSLSDAVLLLRLRAYRFEQFRLSPWPREWGGPDVNAVVEAVARMLGRRDHAHALEVFLDDRLATAALFAAIGYAPSAHAQLAQADVAPSLLEARRALERAPVRPLAEPSALLPERPWGAEAERVFQRLRSTPEPAVALASPHWMLGQARGALMSRLMAEGRFEAARAVRPVLDRADLRRDLEPFWILPGSAENGAAVEDLARWLAARSRTRPGEAAWLRFAEDTCRRLWREEA